MSFGFLVAVCIGAMFLPLAALFDPMVRDVGIRAATSGLFTFLDRTMRDGDPSSGFAALGFVFSAVLIAVCALPVAISGLIGQIARVRGWFWYVGASGFRRRLALDRPRDAGAGPGATRQPARTAHSPAVFPDRRDGGMGLWLIAARGRASRRG